MTPLPAWVDPGLWAEYVAQRKKDKKEMGPSSVKGRMRRLYEIHAAGHDVNRSIEEAINGHWLDFYAPKEKEIEPKPIPRDQAEERMRQDEQRRLDEYIARTNGRKLRSV